MFGIMNRIVRAQRSIAAAVQDRRLSSLGLSRSHGERQYPSKPGSLDGIDPDHIFRYEWAKPFCHGRCVLDYGCGTGYGSFVVSDGAQQVLGFDVSSDALDWADYYRRLHKNVSFTAVRPDETFDCTICFECIEHVADPIEPLDWIAAHTREFAFISTPEPRAEGKWSEFHTAEFTRDKFVDMLGIRFDVEHVDTQVTHGCRVVLARCRPKGEPHSG